MRRINQAADTVISTEGDTISAIAYRLYGSSRHRVEEILERNPGLCRYPAPLPAGIAISLPIQQNNNEPAVIKTVNLWD
ncbi:tail protein X [Eikenella corrodens]|uniref:tail protein X n=1 Tax=Eikenella corrodens TaxID=539 RepID=UPI000667F2FB|nr:tail protein X [Eikenella corrodens]DAX58733.1 MAG TPA: tail protein [Caudoviricetes sp.]